MNINQDQYGIAYRSRQRAGYFQEYTRNSDSNPENTKAAGTGNEEPKSYREQILEKMEEMAENIRKGTIQPKFQIGAQAFTIKEWEKFLEKFDAAEEKVQEAVQAHIAEVEKQAEKEAMRRAADHGASDADKVTSVSCKIVSGKAETLAAETVAAITGTEAANAAGTDMEETAALLTSEITKCNYPTDDPDKKHWYITCYGQDGISCKEAYYDGTKWVNNNLWSLSYTEKGQYEKVMSFLQRFPQDANLRFAAHENFWKDFLTGEIDENDFAAFFESTKDGVPDYTYEKDGSVYIDRDKIKYAKYMNDFGTRMYTGEEMELIQRAILNENRKSLTKLSDQDGNMPISHDNAKEQDSEEDDIRTQIVTKSDGSVVLQITTQYGVMELEVTQAQKFGLMMDVRGNDKDLNQNNRSQAFSAGLRGVNI